jgi:toluene monooxygenase system ferredoxin subunit
MAFHRVCSIDDVWEGDMQGFSVGGKPVIVINQGGGVVHVYDGICPHQDYPLAEGVVEDGILTCAMHLWQFDVSTGEGVNPTGCSLKKYALKIEGNDVIVDVEAGS